MITENKTKTTKTIEGYTLSIPDGKLKRYQVTEHKGYYFHNFVFEVATEPYSDYVFSVTASRVHRNKERTGWEVYIKKDELVEGMTIAKSVKEGDTFVTDKKTVTDIADFGFMYESK